MQEKSEERTEAVFMAQDHPWIVIPDDDSVDEDIRYSLDELRFV